MKHSIFHVISILIVLMTIKGSSILAQQVRPVRDDVGFCWQPAEVESLIKYLDSANKTPKSSTDKPVAGISPHDDYLYAGSVYYPLFKNIKAKEIIIFGVTHGTVRKEINDPKNIIILDDFKAWKGPFGNVTPSALRDKIKKELDSAEYTVNNKAQTLEHSIEAMIPFLQYYNRDIKITPVMITAMPFEKMDEISSRLAEIISSYMKESNLKAGEDIFFLMSSDANHYGEDFNNSPFGLDEDAHRKATDKDKTISDTYFNGKMDLKKIKNLADELWAQTADNKPALSWCGRYSIPFGLLTTVKTLEKVSKKSLTGELLKYSDTWTEGVIPIKHTHLGLTAPFSLRHWVGFLSAGFYLE